MEIKIGDKIAMIVITGNIKKDTRVSILEVVECRDEEFSAVYLPFDKEDLDLEDYVDFNYFEEGKVTKVSTELPTLWFKVDGAHLDDELTKIYNELDLENKALQNNLHEHTVSIDKIEKELWSKVSAAIDEVKFDENN